MRYLYPPISNQEAEWVKTDPAVEEQLRRSDFYMIVARTEAFFDNIAWDEESSALRFTFRIGEEFTDQCSLRIPELSGLSNESDFEVTIEAGEKIIRIVREPQGSDPQMVDWFTTEKLIHDKSRNIPGIEGFDSYREAAVYDLLYVGISTARDAYERLLEDGHKARLRILGNEPQRNPGSRVTDEIYLLFFSLDPLVIQVFDPDSSDHEFTTSGPDPSLLVADAEKAFVQLLDPEYNKTKFKEYPAGKDGLYGSDYIRYGYVIAEDVVLNTRACAFTGARRGALDIASNAADSIFVEGDDVVVLRGTPTKPGSKSPAR